MKDYALVTFVVGEEYADLFNIVKYSWKKYADKCNADLIIVNDYLDYSSLKGRSPIWQKLLLVNTQKLKKYKTVCYLDSDIYINSESPSIFDNDISDKIGVVRHESIFYPNNEIIHNKRHLEVWDVANRDPVIAGKIINLFKTYYSNYGLKLDDELKFNAGVLLFNPQLHGTFFENIYYKYINDAFDQDQTAINYELITNNIYQEIDNRFNAQLGGIFSQYYPFLNFMDGKAVKFLKCPIFRNLSMMCLANVIEINYIIHFAGLRWPFIVLEQLLSNGFNDKIDYQELLENLIDYEK